METAAKKRLGDRLTEAGLIDGQELQVALREQQRYHRPLGEILVSLGFVTEEDVARFMAADMGLEFLTAQEVRPDPLILSALDPSFVREAQAFPYAMDRGSLRVVMVDPGDPRQVAAVRERFPYPLMTAMTSEEELLELVRMHLQVRTSRVADLLAEVDPNGRDVPVEELTEAVLLDGIYRNATDIHIEPEDHVTRVRHRVDGVLRGGENLPTSITASVVSRIKILSNLDIAERRRPQDGRLRLMVDERTVDMRVSIMPCNHGENVVLRILDGGGASLRLTALGLSEAHAALLRRVADRPHGLFLLTGPTGSGKTTTLYALLSAVDAVHRKVATIEDPIEYRLPLLRQSQIDPAVGFGFAEGLRSLLRQDPDVILVGEIRDQETADMAIKASMTGHLVLSTLHTNSSLGAFARLVDMGIEPYLVEDSLVGAMSQRLVRTNCRGCTAELPATDAERAFLGESTESVRRGKGCERCGGSGYQGRTAVVEFFLPEPQVLEAMRTGAGADRVLALAREGGFQPLVDDGRRLIAEGRTTVEEVQRVGRNHRMSEAEREGV